jgi:DNA polymerase-1
LQASEYLESYRKTYSILMDFLDTKGEEALSKGMAKTIIGRIRWIPQMEATTRYTSAEQRKLRAFYARAGKNHPILGTDGDMLKTAMALLSNPLQKLDASMVNIIHDEIVVEVAYEHAIEGAILLKSKMIEAGQQFLKKVPVLADVKIRDNWWKDDSAKDSEYGQQLWLV